LWRGPITGKVSAMIPRRNSYLLALADLKM